MTAHARGLMVFNLALAALVGLFLVACCYVIVNEIALQVVTQAVRQ